MVLASSEDLTGAPSALRMSTPRTVLVDDSSWNFSSSSEVILEEEGGKHGRKKKRHQTKFQEQERRN